ncbi:MAG: hypothetical protein ACREM3_22475 [Candidatus Rokuibacteriota bacterium]
MSAAARARRILLTLFIAYHVTVLLVSNLPSRGPTRGLHWIFTHYAQMGLYLEATGSPQNWGLFSPNPARTNEYVRVLVKDRNGGSTDVQHDTYGRQRYPYLWYDYLRKVNRRLGTVRAYQRGYAAWVCRTWERAHGGRPAVEVRFVRLSTRIPSPPVAYTTMGYDPMALPVHETDAGMHTCAELPHGQLPPSLRRRFGLPAVPEGTFKPADLHTWWDRRESQRRGDSRGPSVGETRHDDRTIE